MIKFQIVRWFILLGIAGTMIVLRETWGTSLENGSLISTLINTSSILSGIVIAYVLAKIYQLSQDKAKDQHHIDKLSSKLNNFRKLLVRLLKSPSFWVKYDDIVLLKKKYPELSFHTIHNEEEDNENADKFWREEENFSSTTADLYLAMEAITGPVEDIEDIDNKVMRYDEAYLNGIQPALNQIWFYLEEKFAKHTAGLINDQGIWEPYHDSIRNLTIRIDNRLKRKEFDRTTVAELANTFQEEYIPEYLELLKTKKSRVTRSLVSLVLTLSAMIISGTIIPMILMFFRLPETFIHEALFWCGMVLIGGVVNLILEMLLLLFRDFNPPQKS